MYQHRSQRGVRRIHDHPAIVVARASVARLIGHTISHILKALHQDRSDLQPFCCFIRFDGACCITYYQKILESKKIVKHLTDYET